MDLQKFTMDANCKQVGKAIFGKVIAMPSAMTWGYRYWETAS
jgi:hypothetical protein